ncbi:MAG: hypothetical protein H7X89_07025 [Rhizobiales bacterium]|nr:hypothetical protein [Hyphomicrobiales bacterium]
MSLAEKVSQVPELFDQKDSSTATLLKEAGYLDAPQTLKVADVEDVIAKEPKLADKWLKRGHDQRLVGGWGLERESGQYVLRDFGSRLRIVEESRPHAIAEFVVRYVGFIARVLSRHRTVTRHSGRGDNAAVPGS